MVVHSDQPPKVGSYSREYDRERWRADLKEQTKNIQYIIITIIVKSSDLTIKLLIMVYEGLQGLAPIFPLHYSYLPYSFLKPRNGPRRGARKPSK